MIYAHVPHVSIGESQEKKSNTAEEEKRVCWGRDNGGRFLQTSTRGAVPVLASSKSAPEPGSSSQFIQHPPGANRELGGNNTPPLPWTLLSCVNLKLRELFHMSYHKGENSHEFDGMEKTTQLTDRNLELSQVFLFKVHPIRP